MLDNLLELSNIAILLEIEIFSAITECQQDGGWYSLGFDQFMNLLVDNAMEVNGNEKIDIGTVVIIGDNVVTIEALELIHGKETPE
ncbi:LSM domain, eukaryotic/archaea-type [Dillenia turbinata]|uniref:Sm protein G n=1 Tax=Dillenia turbinata TaxID=194707 RepID=A0AAN8UUX5_9MAGN